MWSERLRRAAVLVLAGTMILSIFAVSVSAQPEKGPAVDEIIVETRATGDVAIGDVATGRLDAYLKSLSPAAYSGIPEDWKANLRLIPNSGGIWEITMNPVHDDDSPYIVTVEGKEYFNPFAIREVRFALNYLINRKYLIDEILSGGGVPMFGAVNPLGAGNDMVKDIYEKYGFTEEGDEARGLQMIEEAMERAASELGGRLVKTQDPRAPAGYWWTFDGEPVTVKFFIRVEDERHEEGLYVANQIEKAGIKVDRIEGNFQKCIYTVYLTDPRDYEWNLYTAGWGATSGYGAKYPDDDVAWFYAPWYGWMPAYEVEGWWEWQNETIDELTQDVILGKISGMEAYWDRIRKAVDIGVYESIRVFTVLTIDYFPVNDIHVTKIGYDLTTGLWSYWPWRTVETSDGQLKVAVEAQQAAMYTSAWNPIGGFDDVYSHAVWRAIHDEGAPSDPVNVDPIPCRVNWTLHMGYNMTDEGPVGTLDVPADAVVYDSSNDSWVKIGPGHKAVAKVNFHLLFGNWHDGSPMTMADVMYSIGWDYEWSHLDGEGDVYYDQQYASSMGPILDTIVGFQFFPDNDTVVVYHNYKHVASDAFTATYYTPWPTIPWEVMEAMSDMVANGGASGTNYSWYKTEGREYISMITPSHVDDIKAAINKFRSRGYVPPYISGVVTPGQARARYDAALRFIEQYHHAAISNGPFILVRYDPNAMFMQLVANRDPTYPFTPDYWFNRLSIVTESVESVDAPVSITAGEDFSVTVSVTEQGQFPEKYTKPAEEAYVLVELLDPSGNTIFSQQADLVSPGTFSVSVPGSATEGKAEGSYTIRVTAAKTAQATGASVVTQELVVTAPAPPPPPPSGNVTPTPPPPPPPPPAAAGPNWMLIGGIIVVIIIIAAALLLRKK